MVPIGVLRNNVRLGFILGFSDESIIAFLDRKVNWTKMERLKYFDRPEIKPFVHAETGYIPTIDEARRGLEQVTDEVNQRRLVKAFPFPTMGISKLIPVEFNSVVNPVLLVDDETCLRWLSLIDKLKKTEFFTVTESVKWSSSIQRR